MLIEKKSASTRKQQISAFLPEFHTCGIYTPNSQNITSTEHRGKWLELKLSMKWMLFLIERGQNTQCNHTFIACGAAWIQTSQGATVVISALKLVHRTVEECGVVWLIRLSSHHMDDHACAFLGNSWHQLARLQEGMLENLASKFPWSQSDQSSVGWMSDPRTPNNRISSVCC